MRTGLPPDPEPCPHVITRSTFRPAWWLPGPHLQTLYPSLFRQRQLPALTRERIELPDGDFIDLDWTRKTGGKCVLILHGLEGRLESHYTSGILCALAQQGYRAGLLYFRGCSGEPNRLQRSYHSGETGDLDYAIQHINKCNSQQPIALIGYSLGGNVVLKWLGEQGDTTQVTTAITISVPFDLNSAALKLNQGLSRIYQRHLLHKLRQSVIEKSALHAPTYPLDQLHALRTFRQFDNSITAPLHGFRDVDDYYTRSSSKPFLKNIKIPTLLIQSEDDPFLPAAAIPGENELSPEVTLELSRHGGHVGFLSGNKPLQPQYWIEKRILQHLANCC